MRNRIFPIERRIRRAGLLVLAGLVIEAASFLWLHPLAFVLFLGVGCLLILVGVVVYLLSLPEAARGELGTETR